MCWAGSLVETLSLSPKYLPQVGISEQLLWREYFSDVNSVPVHVIFLTLHHGIQGIGVCPHGELLQGIRIVKYMYIIVIKLMHVDLL